MSLIFSEIELANARQDELLSMGVNALVDSGASHICVPRHMAIHLKREALDQREVTYANGCKEAVEYVGPARIESFGRYAFTGAIVMGDTVLPAFTPIDSIDLLVDMRRSQLIPNPENSKIPGALAMGVRTGELENA
jgi:hypothetical protein